jgi:transposase
MPRYKPQERNGLLLPVVLSEQILPGSFAFALDYLVDHELDFTAMDIGFKNDETGASAYDPRVMLKIVLLAYSQGLISSRSIEQACLRNVQFIAISGHSQPSHTHIAKFVCNLRDQIQPLFRQVLMTCDAQGLIGRALFAIDGVKLPSNASKERSGTHSELKHRADRLDKAANKILELYMAQDKQGEQPPLDAKRQARMDALRQEAARTRAFLANTSPRLNRKGQEIKTNITDPDSAKMATSKGGIQGYAAQATVDSHHQVILAADVMGSGSEQTMLLPMIEQAAPFRTNETVITADAGYHSAENVQQLHEQHITALIADNQMRKRDERFKDQDKYKSKPDPMWSKTTADNAKPIKRFGPQDFCFHDEHKATCPAGKVMTSPGSIYTTARGLHYRNYTARAADCQDCPLRGQCLKGPIKPNDGRGRQVCHFLPKTTDTLSPSELMKQAIDSPEGRQRYSQRIGTVEPVFANLRHNKRLNRFNLRGTQKVRTQWTLYCMVHNIEKLANHGYAR